MKNKFINKEKNMNKEKKIFKGKLNNEIKELEVLYTFKSMKTNKDYIIYTDNTYDKNNNLNVFASIYYPFNQNKELEKITDNSDFEEVEKFLKEMSSDNNE